MSPGQSGMLAPHAQEMATAAAFRGPGTRQGTASPMSARDRAGAMECDESCRGYTGNPRDAGGMVHNDAQPNKRP